MKDRRVLFSLIGASVVCMASPAAFAQTSGGTITYSQPPTPGGRSLSGRGSMTLAMPDPSRDTPDSIHTYQVMLDYGDCAARLGGGFVAEILASPADSRSEKHDLRELQDRAHSCRRSGLPNILSLQRGVLAEGMYKDMFEKAPPLPSYGAAKAEYQAFIDLEKKRNHLRSKNDQAMINATDCLAAQQPAIADRILRSEHGSDAEANAMDSLFAYASKCAGPTRPSTLSRSFLRAFLADSAYHYAKWKMQQESAPEG